MNYQEATLNIRIHDFRFHTTIEYHQEDGEIKWRVMTVKTFFTALDGYGIKLSSSGNIYVFDAYLTEIEDECQAYIDNLRIP